MITNEPNEHFRNQVGETHDTQQSKRINKTRKNESSAWEFYIKVSENGKTSYAICPVCNIKLGAKLRNGTTTLLIHGCFKEWKKNERQQSVSNVKSSAKANPKNKASQKIGAGAPPQAKRRKLVCKSRRGKRKKKLLVLVCYVICKLSIVFILSFLVLLCPL
jgi:hypothetical protein